MQLIPFNRNKNKQTDNELLRNFLEKGDTEILGELFGRYLHLVYGVCLKYFREPEKSKDAVIQLYEKVQLDIGKHEVQNFKSWLYVVTKNHCLMELRKTKPGNIILISEENEWPDFMEKEVELHPVDRNPDELPPEALEECLKKLNSEQRNCIKLFYLKSRSYREIAGILKIEEKKVKSHIQNGKRNLKICLEEKK